MGSIIIAIFIILMGAVIRIVGPSMGKPNAAGSTKLAGYGFMFAGILLALSNAVTVIAEAQKIISAGLTPAYLTFHYIEKLAELPPGSVVYVPTEGGVPLMRMIGGGGN